MPWKLSENQSTVPCDTSLPIQEFRHNFANSNTYERCGDWPHTTILFFNISIRDTLTGSVDDRWIRVENISQQEHAEDRMIEYLEYRKSTEPNIVFGPILRMYLSYSPCSDCAYKLIAFVQKYFVQNALFPRKIQIGFGTFYKTNTSESPNYVGLLELLKSGFELYVFNGEDHWKHFLNDIEIPWQDQEQYLQFVRTQERRGMEIIDQDKLFQIQGQANAQAQAQAQALAQAHAHALAQAFPTL